jgi:hypothetical protein
VPGRAVSRALVIATGVTATGDREVLGLEAGDSEDGAFWAAFLKGLRARGLTGVQLVVSDHHLGLREAIASVFVGSSWQRCRVHFMRNVVAKVPEASAEMVAAAIRTVFAQPDAAHVRSQLAEVTRMLGVQFPVVAAMLGDAAEDLLAFTAFPQHFDRHFPRTFEPPRQPVGEPRALIACRPLVAWPSPSTGRDRTPATAPSAGREFTSFRCCAGCPDRRSGAVRMGWKVVWGSVLLATPKGPTPESQPERSVLSAELSARPVWKMGQPISVRHWSSSSVWCGPTT